MDTTAKTAEDIIGMVPHTLGYTPESSLVAIIVVTDEEGRQSCDRTLRVDFDLETAVMTLDRGGEWMRELVCRSHTPSGVFLIFYDDAFAAGLEESDAPPRWSEASWPETDWPESDWDDDDDIDLDIEEEYQALHRALVRAATDEMAIALAAEGIDTLSAWWVSDGRFGRLDDCDDLGTDLRLAQSSACATELISSGSAPVGNPADLVIRPATAEARAAFHAADPSPGPSIIDAFDILREVYPQLLGVRAIAERIDRERLDEMMTPRLVRTLDCLLVNKWSRDALEMIISFDHPDFLPKRMGRFGPGELAPHARRCGTSRLAAEQMIGLSPHAPVPRDIQVGIAFIESYVRWADPIVRANAYGVIAWLHWSIGGSTLTEQYALAALDCDPQHSMGQLLVDAVTYGLLPRWLMRKDAPAPPWA